MPKYAAFNPAVPAPSPVIGWYDTDTFTYKTLPDSSNLLAVTNAQWAARMANPSAWAVNNGALVAYTPPVPPPTLEQQAASAAKAGLTVALSGSMTLAATLFPTDSTTQAKISAMADMAARGILPVGATGYPIKDSAGNWHTLTASAYQALAAAIGSYVAACILIADGNPLGATELPSNSVTLTV
jgi:hypothetical protein